MIRCGAFSRLGLALTVAFASVATGPAEDRVPPPSSVRSFTDEQLAAAVFAESNRVRVANGCDRLKPLRALTSAAEDQAVFMALTLRTGHTTPIHGQETPADRVRRQGLTAATVAENVLSLPRDDEAWPAAPVLAAKMVALWMSSPAHRANLLDARPTHLGCAVRFARLPGGQESAFAVQVLARR